MGESAKQKYIFCEQKAVKFLHQKAQNEDCKKLVDCNASFCFGVKGKRWRRRWRGWSRSVFCHEFGKMKFTVILMILGGGGGGGRGKLKTFLRF